MIFIHLAFIACGSFVAGYLGIYEILIEFVLVTWASFKLIELYRGYDEDNSELSETSITWLKNLKSHLIAHAVDGRTIQAAIPAVLFGVLFGSLFTLFALMFNPPGKVFSREVKEIILDFIIFTPYLFLIANTLKYTIDSAREIAHQHLEELERDCDNYLADDPRDPNFWDFMGQYAVAQGEVGQTLLAGLQGFLAFGVLTVAGYLILSASVAVPYFIGMQLESQRMIVFLNNLRDWNF